MVGKTIGKYQFIEELGHGSMGVVYRGQHIDLPREVVIKELLLTPFPVSTRVQIKARFRREIYVQAQLNHPSIARVYESFTKGDNYYLVMEYVEGVSLRDLLAHQGLPTPAQALYLCKQALVALEYAHNVQFLDESDVQRVGIIHRDLKPANLLVGSGGRLKITDFGIIKMPDKQSMAPPNFQPGTVEYMPPEQLRGLELDVRSDMYSLGVTFYEMLTGHLPVARPQKTSDGDERRVSLDPTPPSVLDLRKDIPSPISALIMRAIRRNPSERFQTAAEFLKTIKDYERNPDSSEVASQPPEKSVQLPPEDSTIIEIASPPISSSSIQSPVISSTVAAAGASRSGSQTFTAATADHLDEQHQWLVDSPANQQVQQQLNRSEGDRRDVKPSRSASRSVPGSDRRNDVYPNHRAAPQNATVTRSTAKASNEPKNSMEPNLFENWENRPNGLQKILVGVAAAAVLLVIFSTAYLLHRQRDVKVQPLQAAESSPNATVTSAVTTANAATPEPAKPAPTFTTGNVRMLKQARLADLQGRFGRAVALYQKYLISNPSEADAAAISAQLEQLNQLIGYLDGARDAVKRRDYPSARENFTEALKLRPNSKMVKIGLARVEKRLPRN